jgi:DNA-binding NarL/FixJ family response regulator
MEKISVYIIDDYELSRIGLTYMLKDIPFVEQIEVAANSKELFELLKKEEPDIILMDIQIGEEYGVEITKKVLQKYPDIYVVGITSSHDFLIFKEMLEAGASAFVLKKITKEELQQALEEVLNGNNYFSREYLSLAKQLSPTKKRVSKLKLSDREKEVLQLLCRGFSNQEIAKKLSVSAHTSDAHRRKLLQKMEARNTANMIMIAVRDGLIELDE